MILKKLMNNPFDYTPDEECERAFRELTVRLDTFKKSRRPDDVSFCRHLEEGCMLGVLIAEDSAGEHHTLYAFSGQLGKAGFHFPGFVDPVFDYLAPDGYFKSEEADISRQNKEIDLFEKGVLTKAHDDYNREKQRIDETLAEFKEKCRESKFEREIKRMTGGLSEDEIAAMTKQSQFEKAELHRLKKKLKAELEPFSSSLKASEARLSSLKEKRKIDSEALQTWLFSNFQLLNARGESKSLGDIFADTSFGIPPSGAGECCAPKLLQAAYRQGWTPLTIAEYWYGKAKEGTVRTHGNHYPACRGRCLPILKWMLQGLSVEPPLESNPIGERVYVPEIIFENEWFCVVDKPEGMLSVPGKGETISLQQWLREKYCSEKREVKPVHRLDQDTSGLIVAAFGDSSYKLLQSLFATRKIKKTYIADLTGDYLQMDIPAKGRIELPLSSDWLDRPRQRVDFESGKVALTEYEFDGVEDGISRVVFHPLTGRTHQLRVHAASAKGLGMPIVGDRLYGNKSSQGQNRLHLHAQKIEFTFPLDGQTYCFESATPF